jgi:hypothetical protein
MLLLPLSTYQFTVSYRALLATISLAAGLAALGVASPAPAGADATIAPPPIFSTAPGLPDNRVYEQVSPTDKNGNDAGASTNQALAYGGRAHYALAAADGNGVLFEGSGAMGETAAGYNLYFVAQRSAAGWSTRAIMSRAQKSITTLSAQPERVDPSADLSHVVFKAASGLFAPPPYPQCGYGHQGPNQLYLSGPDPFVAATWLERPEISDPIENCASAFGVESGAPVGGTPDFSTIYFTFPGTLLPEDASRAPHAHGEGQLGESNVEAWGLYEDKEGVLREAGVLPNGSLDPFGAVPAASQRGRALVGNQVSADGLRLFFVSPDPDSCGRGNNCASDPPELYVRENGEKTVLVSRDTLAPELGGLPAAAPAGVSEMPNPRRGRYEAGEPVGSDVFAAPNGSQAFFQSEDKLTCDPECPPENTNPKIYDFDVETGSLTYLPGVSGQIVASSQDGSSFAFVDSRVSPAELDLWSDGPDGGTVTPITQMNGHPTHGVGADVRVARMSSDGSVVVFMTPLRLSEEFNSGTELEQIYRYDVPANTLSCVSCAPAGVTPTSDAEMSALEANEEGGLSAGLQNYAGMVDERGVSSDGDRIFFDTADPLVPQVTNTGSTVVGEHGIPELQGRDVYEWENGTVYLLSSGKSTRSSFFLDNSENGDDVFFATTDGLVPGDTDGAYDVYDARVPHPGDNPPPAAVPCEGSVCQGPPRVPAPLGAPASATFTGLGNIAPEPAPTSAAPKKTTKKTVKCKKGFVKQKTKCVKSKPKKKTNTAKKTSHSGRTK